MEVGCGVVFLKMGILVVNIWVYFEFRSGPFGNRNSLGSVLGPDRTTSTGNLLAI